MKKLYTEYNNIRDLGLGRGCYMVENIADISDEAEMVYQVFIDEKDIIYMDDKIRCGNLIKHIILELSKQFKVNILDYADKNKLNKIVLKLYSNTCIIKNELQTDIKDIISESNENFNKKEIIENLDKVIEGLLERKVLRYSDFKSGKNYWFNKNGKLIENAFPLKSGFIRSDTYSLGNPVLTAVKNLWIQSDLALSVASKDEYRIYKITDTKEVDSITVYKQPVGSLWGIQAQNNPKLANARYFELVTIKKRKKSINYLSEHRYTDLTDRDVINMIDEINSLWNTLSVNNISINSLIIGGKFTDSSGRFHKLPDKSINYIYSKFKEYLINSCKDDNKSRKNKLSKIELSDIKEPKAIYSKLIFKVDENTVEFNSSFDSALELEKLKREFLKNKESII